jgi:hypothetical protein
VSQGGEQPDFFVAIEDRGEYPRSYDTELLASGNGVEVISALTRLALLSSALDAEKFSPYSTLALGLRGGYQVWRKHGHQKAARDREAPGVLVVGVGSADLTHLVSPSVGKQSDVKQKHEDALKEQIKQGARSPQDVIDEMVQQSRDEKLIWRQAGMWFDPEGRQLISPMHRKSVLKHGDPAPLGLQQVTRQKIKNPVLQAAKDAVFAALPSSNAVPRKIRVVNLNKREDGSIILTQPLVGDEIVRTELFGYVEDGNFVPVFDTATQQEV